MAAKNSVDQRRTTPWTMWTDAKYYRIAAQTLMTRVAAEDTELIQKQLILPTLAMLAMSIESTMKSYLYAAWVDPNELKFGYGHDLVLLRRAVDRHSEGEIQILSRELEPLIDLLRDPYVAKQLQYRAIGQMTIPIPELLCNKIIEFMAALKPFVQEQDRLHCEKHKVQVEPYDDT